MNQDIPTGTPDSDEPLEIDVQADSPTITVWYEGDLKFGHLGTPQEAINIQGKVTDPDGIKSLHYSLNGGSSVKLTVGPTSTRLANEGDFNAEIDVSIVKSGTNTLTLTAVDKLNNTTSKNVTFTYTKNRIWQMPYATNWADADSIFDQAHVIDGLWQLTSNGVRTAQPGYDRLIAIGDYHNNSAWTNYEVQTSFIVHNFPTANEGGVGIITRWQGHVQVGTEQPAKGWGRIGAYGYYSNRTRGLALWLNDNSADRKEASFPGFSLNQVYNMKFRAEGNVYSLKVWPQGTQEPADWNMSYSDSSDEMSRGSILLVAHKADVTFYDVSIYPLNGFTLTVNSNGVGGSVTRSPSKPLYNLNEEVTLEAKPNPGYTFVGWTTNNGLAISGNPAQVTIKDHYTVIANFAQNNPTPSPTSKPPSQPTTKPTSQPEFTNQIYLPSITK